MSFDWLQYLDLASKRKYFPDSDVVLEVVTHRESWTKQKPNVLSDPSLVTMMRRG